VSVLWLFLRPSQYVEVIWILTLINNILFMNYGSVNQLVISLWIMACYNLLTISIFQWTIGPLECVIFFLFLFFSSFPSHIKENVTNPKLQLFKTTKHTYTDRKYYPKFWKGSIPKLWAPNAAWKGLILNFIF
jgi:hypothetical protein